MARIKRLDSSTGERYEIQPFEQAPDELAGFIEEQWLPRIELDEKVGPDRSFPPFHPRNHSLVPQLEWEAIEALAQAISELPQTPQVDRDLGRPADWAPDSFDDAFDRWRELWAQVAWTEADKPSAYTDKERAAFDMLKVASQLRTAVEKGNAEKAAALGMLLAIKTIEGGYGLKLRVDLAAKEAKEAMEAEKKQKQLAALQLPNEPYSRAKTHCIEVANRLWADEPSKRIGLVCEECLSSILGRRDEYPEWAEQVPLSVETIRDWLTTSDKVTISPAARKGGRPPKK